MAIFYEDEPDHTERALVPACTISLTTEISTGLNFLGEMSLPDDGDKEHILEILYALFNFVPGHLVQYFLKLKHMLPPAVASRRRECERRKIKFS